MGSRAGAARCPCRGASRSSGSGRGTRGMSPILPSVNGLAAPLLERLLRDADRLRIEVTRDAGGVTLIDAGIAARGSIEAGLQIAEICLGGLGKVRLVPAP